MNTYQLEAVMNRDRFSQSKFIGVFPMDLLPKNKIEHCTRPFCLIINSAPSTNEGEHWLAVYVDVYGEGQLFDSYGNNANFYDRRLETFLKKNCTEHSYNKSELQALWSDVCGQHCLYFLLHRSRHIPAKTILELFGRNKLVNDSLVDAFIHKHFPSVFQIHANTFTRMLQSKQQKSQTRYTCTHQ